MNKKNFSRFFPMAIFPPWPTVALESNEGELEVGAVRIVFQRSSSLHWLKVFIHLAH
jgi:hypothetical protein